MYQLKVKYLELSCILLKLIYEINIAFPDLMRYKRTPPHPSPLAGRVRDSAGGVSEGRGEV